MTKNGRLIFRDGAPSIPIEWDKVVLFTDGPGGPWDGRVPVKWKGKIRIKRNGKRVTLDPTKPVPYKEYDKVHEVDPTGSVRYGRRPFSDDAMFKEIRYSVWHHSVTASAKNTEAVLRERNLSVHFGLDEDGTIYQFLPLAVRDRSSEAANDRGIGIEVTSLVDVTKPPPKGYENRQVVKGMSQGVRRTVYDYTEPQKAAAAALCAALCAAFPRMAPRAPDVLDKSQQARCLRGNVYGILGHAHVTSGAKWDPNPAFDFKRCERAARVAVAKDLMAHRAKTIAGVQRALQCLGYIFPSFGPDGEWGDESQAALDAFREHESLDRSLPKTIHQQDDARLIIRLTELVQGSQVPTS